MPQRVNGGVFNEQVLTGSLAHYVLYGADFSGAIDSFGRPVPFSAAEIIFTRIETGAYIDIMNPNSQNISFALEEGRSVWDDISLTTMVRSLGPDVGVDHIDCTVCTVERVPYVWGSTSVTSFLDLTDTPNSYVGSAGYLVTVNPTETGLIFTPNSANYLPVAPGSSLLINVDYFVTGSGTVFLPPLTGYPHSAGQAITITKPIGANVFINAGQVSDTIATDLGNTDSIQMDVTQELVFVVSGTNTWNLQIGSVL